MSIKDLKNLSEDEARKLLESVLWPEGPVCPHCGNCDQARIGHLAANPEKKVRAGLKQCKECRKQFTVTVNTVFASSKLPLSTWLYIVGAMCASKKGISAKQLQREFGSTNYEAFWFACHRVRHAMKQGALATMGGEGEVVEADETFVGGFPRFAHTYKRTDKTPVFTLVQRGGGARSFVTTDVRPDTLGKYLLENADRKSVLMTDENNAYNRVGRLFADHRSTKHGRSEYVRVERDGTKTHSNTAESYFSLLKRGLIGTFHQVSPEHLQRYVNEFDFRWSTRKDSDVARTLMVLKQAEGKRLMYRKSSDIGETK